MAENNHEKLQKQIDELRAQGRTDAEFTSLMLRDMRNDIKEMGAEVSGGMREIARTIETVTQRIEGRIDHVVANYDERLRQIEGRQRLKEQRFDRMLEGAAASYVTKEELEALKERVRRLEEAS